MLNNEIKHGVDILRQGGLVAMPTETVYGLAADAKNPDALKKIFHAKGRPIDHPLIVHIGDISQLSDWAIDVSPEALLLAKTFWPGPLTLILKKAPHVSDIVTGGQDTIGIRVPKHPVAQALLKAFGGGVAAPSANRFGRISPTTAEAVREELGDRVDLVLDGGQCEVGVESTIVDVSGKDIRILRPGMITVQQIETVLHHHLSQAKQQTPRVSGSMESHYAPVTKTRLMNTSELAVYLKSIHQLPVAVLLRDHSPLVSQIQKNNPTVECVVLSENAAQYAHDIYQVLRNLDKKQLTEILIERVPDELEWEAIRDRLQRAAD